MLTWQDNEISRTIFTETLEEKSANADYAGKIRKVNI